jgi:hypothetical protein
MPTRRQHTRHDPRTGKSVLVRQHAIAGASSTGASQALSAAQAPALTPPDTTIEGRLAEVFGADVIDEIGSAASANSAALVQRDEHRTTRRRKQAHLDDLTSTIETATPESRDAIRRSYEPDVVEAQRRVRSADHSLEAIEAHIAATSKRLKSATDHCITVIDEMPAQDRAAYAPMFDDFYSQRTRNPLNDRHDDLQ